MPQKVLISFSDEFVAKLGASKTQSDYQAAVDAAFAKEITELNVVSLTDVNKLFLAQISTFNASVEKVSTDLKAIASDVAKVDPAKILADATAAGSMAAAKALGKVGANGAGAADANPSAELNDKPSAEKLIAAGKFQEAWEASETLQAEFPTAENYVAFAKAKANGRIKIK